MTLLKVCVVYVLELLVHVSIEESCTEWFLLLALTNPTFIHNEHTKHTHTRRVREMLASHTTQHTMQMIKRQCAKGYVLSRRYGNEKKREKKPGRLSEHDSSNTAIIIVQQAAILKAY